MDRGPSVCSLTGATASAAATTATTTAATATTTAATAVATLTAAHWLLGSLSLEPLGVLGVVRLNRESLGPEIWGEVLIGLHESLIGGLKEVLAGSGMARRLSVAILDTGEGQELLGNGGGDDAGTSGGGHELDENGGAFA